MVAGLKQGNRVQGLAIKVFGEKKAKLLFSRSFKTHIIRGVVLRKGQGRKMIVQWDSIDETCSVSSRLLNHDNQTGTTATTRDPPELSRTPPEFSRPA